jgi:curli biogenesis system outer membrane secretion channel CsgG
MMKNHSLTATCAVAILALSACVTPADMSTKPVDGQPAGVLSSGGVSRNSTPYDAVYACYAQQLGARRLSIAVGDIRDYTGKTNQDEGSAVTQGGALMAYSALGKLKPVVQIHERFDTRIADAELTYVKDRVLGDGSEHQIDDETAEGGKRAVPWTPYFGGTVLKSDYFIVGGITELNFNIQSGGAELSVNNVGPRARVYVMNVAVDLRIVGTQSLRVYETVSVQKQLVGYEVGMGIFRFFGDRLIDMNAGVKNQEPLHLGVRMAIEDGILQLVSSVAKSSADSCIQKMPRA